MERCQMKITTTVDGTAQKIVRVGRMEIQKQTILCYEEEKGKVEIRIQDNEVVLQRSGEYSLCLPLRVGKTTAGQLSFGGSTGEIPVRTLEIRRVFDRADLELFLHYELVFGEEVQDMQLHILVKGKTV